MVNSKGSQDKSDGTLDDQWAREEEKKVLLL